MKKIAVIGAGNLGGRHLQALAALKEEACIQVMDVLDASLERAVGWFKSASPGPYLTVEACKSLQELHTELDVVIIATSSTVRAKITEELLANHKVKYLILEKVLFQKEEEYARVNSIIRESGCKAWVNCTRRNKEFYKQMKALFENEPWLQCTLTGSNWGLGCNAIHFLDLFSWWANEKEIHVNAHLDAEPMESKRAGYMEYTGYLQGGGEKLSFVIESLREELQAPIMMICSPHYQCIIREFAHEAELMRIHGGWQKEIIPIDARPQSQMTNLVVEDILSGGDCCLTPYEESMQIHLAFIRAMLEAINLTSKERVSICPIT